MSQVEEIVALPPSSHLLADLTTVDFKILGESLISDGGACLLCHSFSFIMVKSCSKEQWDGFGDSLVVFRSGRPVLGALRPVLI